MAVKVIANEPPNLYGRPRYLTQNQRLRQFLYNDEERTVCNKNCLDWAKIGLFYLIFYGVLAALVAICMWVFLQTLDPRIPKWKLDESIIGTNPGLGFRPMPPSDNVESTLIWFRGSKKEDYQYWDKSLREFLKVYKVPGLTAGRGQHITNCDYDLKPKPDQVCNIEVEKWMPCIEENDFNFQRSAPCIFLKLNKIYGWKPEFYNNASDLPDEMPKSLKKYIAEVPVKKLDTIWVSCEGESPADVENIGPIEYIPERGFQGFFYPYTNSEGYLSPLVAIYFKRPKSGIIINIECKAWAKNIHHSRADRLGSVHFELLID